MSFLEGKPQGQEAGSVCEDVVGRGGVGQWASGDVQHELSPGAEVCRGGPRDDREDPGPGAESREEEKVIRRSGYQGEGDQDIRVSGRTEKICLT